MFCMNCGKKIDDGSKFCPFCGSAIGGTRSTGSQNVSAPTSSQISNIAGASVLKTAKKPIGKNVLVCIAACVIALLAIVVIFIVNSNKFGKTLPERLFKMSVEEYASMTRSSFKDILDKENVLYKSEDLGDNAEAPAPAVEAPAPAVDAAPASDESYFEDSIDVAPVIPDFLTETSDIQFESSVLTSMTDTFMGYDCIYGYGEYEDENGEELPRLAQLGDVFGLFLAFDTQEDFKDFKETIEKYLEKKLVKDETVLKSEGEFFPMYTYLVGCSDKCVGDYFDNPLVMKNWKKILLNYYRNDIGSSSADELVMKCAEYLDSGKDLNKQSMQKIADELGYKMYKFVQIYYPQDVDIETVHQIVPSDKSYIDCMCMMQVFCVPMTEEQYISFAGKMGYDTIGHKNINLNDLETDIDLSFLQEEDLKEQNSAKQALYFMQEYDFDLYSGKYLKDEIEKKEWYLTKFRWDIIKNEKVDLDRNSAEIYLAMTDNYNADVNEYFENDFDKALYLADRNYNIETGEEFKDEDEKRLYFMKNYSYDTLAQKPMDDAVAESLFAYANYLESVFTTEERLGYNLIYIDADDIPECIVWTTNESRQLCRAFVLSYKNGSVESVTVEGEEGYCATVGYIPRSGDFWVSSSDWHWSYDDIFLLDDSFHKVSSTSYGSDCMINGQIVDYEEYDEVTSDIYSDKYTQLYIDMYGQNFDAIYSTLIAAYDAL